MALNSFVAVSREIERKYINCIARNALSSAGWPFSGRVCVCAFLLGTLSCNLSSLPLCINKTLEFLADNLNNGNPTETHRQYQLEPKQKTKSDGDGEKHSH